ncbi:tRNA (adenosine(37)-N6)-threonylcarbamoyltransferase complex dimerization subunit type 1 TsaB [Pacificimonas sp. ICDLI1SI03]
MILAIGTAHRACSLALIQNGCVAARVHDIIGRGHAEKLVPMIADLVGGNAIAHIAVEVGPGSFTGIRVGIAAAKALAFAWGVPVNGFLSTEVLAARAASELARDSRIAVVLDGGRGEVFLQYFTGTSPIGDIRAVPAASVAIDAEATIGTGVPLIMLPAGVRNLGAHIPDAADVRLLVPGRLSTRDATPVYVRPPDAKPPAAR